MVSPMRMTIEICSEEDESAILKGSVCVSPSPSPWMLEIRGTNPISGTTPGGFGYEEVVDNWSPLVNSLNFTARNCQMD